MTEDSERTIRLATAARMISVDARSLRRWLEEDRKLTIPRRGRGGSPFVKVSDVQAVVATRAGTERRHSGNNP